MTSILKIISTISSVTIENFFIIYNNKINKSGNINNKKIKNLLKTRNIQKLS